MSSPRRLRLAVDIGSGMTKYVVAEVDLPRKNVIRELAFGEISIPFGLDWREHDRLTEGVCEKGIAFLQNVVVPKYVELHKQWSSSAPGVTPGTDADVRAFIQSSSKDIVAVGTEVFRRAVNGADFLRSVSAQTGIRIQLIPQRKEAELGFLSGLAIWNAECMRSFPNEADGLEAKKNGTERQEGQNTGPLNACNEFDIWLEAYYAARGGSVFVSEPLSGPNFNKLGSPLIVYDSGGGSFQIVREQVDSSSADGSSLSESYLGTYAVAHATKDLLNLKFPDQEKIDLQKVTPNPCTAAEIEQYLKVIHDHCFDVSSDSFHVPDWLAEKEVLAITGKNGIGRVGGDIVGSFSAKEKTETSEFHPFHPSYAYSPEQLRKAIFSELVGRSDEYLAKMFCSFEGAEPPNYLLPKACSLLVVMETLKIARIHWRPSVGSCPGMLIDDSQECFREDAEK